MHFLKFGTWDSLKFAGIRLFPSSLIPPKRMMFNETGPSVSHHSPTWNFNCFILPKWVSFNDPHITVDGRNPTPPWMYKTVQIMGKATYQLVQDFFHQQYHIEFHHQAPSTQPRLCRHISTDQLLLRLIGHTAANILLEGGTFGDACFELLDDHDKKLYTL